MTNDPSAFAPRPHRVLIASEADERLALMTPVLEQLGHHVVAAAVHADRIPPLVASALPDVAVVSLGPSGDHALELIDRIVREEACPVIALLHAPDPDFVMEACARGVYAVVTDRDPAEWQSALVVALRRFTDFHDLGSAFARRAVIERASGILMERHSLDADAAFALLRGHARRNNRKVSELAAAIVSGHALLPAQL